ncbi:hypothetical protein HMPREF1862_01949 [Varibaculum cambriense]|uniref:Uncharacterized protein n=1 Tax=Varibaculum cambriense TaxID=184870 RepID=A0AB34WX68_9ACTO|nr:hypothetical protein HMPREF1862_01949 [Varibaculum cambriense]
MSCYSLCEIPTLIFLTVPVSQRPAAIQKESFILGYWVNIFSATCLQLRLLGVFF